MSETRNEIEQAVTVFMGVFHAWVHAADRGIKTQGLLDMLATGFRADKRDKLCAYVEADRKQTAARRGGRTG